MTYAEFHAYMKRQIQGMRDMGKDVRPSALNEDLWKRVFESGEAPHRAAFNIITGKVS